MKAGHPQPKIKLSATFIGDVFEVMFEGREIEELIQARHGQLRLACQCLVVNKDEASTRMLPIERLLHGIPRKANWTELRGQMVNASKNGGVSIPWKHARYHERILADQALERVDHPDRVANAGDHLRVGKEGSECSHAAAPETVSIKNEFLGMDSSVIAIK